jgi:hypothetical protein
MDIIIIILIIISIFSFFYKIYLQIKIRNQNRGVSIFLIVFRFYRITDLLPLKSDSDSSREEKLRKRANLALLIFYLSFLAVQILSILF